MKRMLLVCIVLVTLLMALPSAQAAPGSGYDLSWFSVDGGGGNSAGGSYSLSGASGQPDAGGVSGGAYTLAGGFWPGAPTGYRLFLPLVAR